MEKLKTMIKIYKGGTEQNFCRIIKISYFWSTGFSRPS